MLSEALTGHVDGTISWTHDDDFRLATQSVNGGSTVSFAYDDDGILTTAGAVTLTPDATGTSLLSGISVGNVDTVFDYSEFAEPSDLTYTSDSSTIFDVSYARDGLGRIEFYEETTDGVTRDVELGYDLAGRLETVTTDSVLVATYEYDDIGNRTAVIGSGTVSATYDDHNPRPGDLDREAWPKFFDKVNMRKHFVESSDGSLWKIYRWFRFWPEGQIK